MWNIFHQCTYTISIFFLQQIDETFIFFGFLEVYSSSSLLDCQPAVNLDKAIEMVGEFVPNILNTYSILNTQNL